MYDRVECVLNAPRSSVVSLAGPSSRIGFVLEIDVMVLDMYRVAHAKVTACKSGNTIILSSNLTISQSCLVTRRNLPFTRESTSEQRSIR